MGALAGFGSVVALIGMLALVLWAFPRLANAVLGASATRSGELDGLRGLLSVLVILHHCVIVRGYCATGHYVPAPGNFTNLAGEASVALFFVATGYLYWARILGGAKMNWRQLYLGRVRRLVPMYVVSVLILIAIVMAETGFTLRVPATEFAEEIIRWLSFTFLALPDINGLPQTGIIQVVLWTLRYEWQFVFALPLLVLFARGPLPWLLYIAGLVLAFKGGFDNLYAYFVGGLIAAHVRTRPILASIPPRVWDVLGVAALILLLANFHHVYGLPQLVLVTLIFLGALSGKGVWALLRLRPLRFLGLTSYSTYLVHHMLLFVVANHLYGAERFGALAGRSLQGAVLLVSISAVALSTLTYLVVERPWIQPAKG